MLATATGDQRSLVSNEALLTDNLISRMLSTCRTDQRVGMCGLSPLVEHRSA